jgi:5-methylcytosine-specific restriction endonuclease McrA
VTNARRKRKKNLVQLAGGKCQICGYDKTVEALHFHHINPKEKNFGISAAGITRSLKEQKSEIQKCILLCANCHIELHAESKDLYKIETVDTSIKS